MRFLFREVGVQLVHERTRAPLPQEQVRGGPHHACGLGVVLDQVHVANEVERAFGLWRVGERIEQLTTGVGQTGGARALARARDLVVPGVHVHDESAR